MRRKDSPKISVLMASLNVAPYIRQSIVSVITQTLADIEIICIDAGSTDGTFEIIEELAEKDSRIRIIKSEIKSYGVQMNMGLDAAQGEYIAIVETDDYIDSDMLETLYGLASDTGSDMAKGTYRQIFEDESGRSGGWDSDPIPGNIREGYAFNPRNSPEVHSWERYIWNGIYRREFLNGNGIRFSETPGAAYQDISFQQMVLNSAERVVYTRKPLYNYRTVRPGASTWNGKGIKNLYYEYNRIFSWEKLKPERRDVIRSRMLWAFICEYEKELLRADYDKSRLEYGEEIEWFFGQLKEIYEESCFSKELLNDSYYVRAERLLYNEESFLNSGKKAVRILREWLESVRKLCKGREIIVYGSGRYGNACVVSLMRNGLIPVTVIDQNPDRQGNLLYGFHIGAPEEVTSKYKDAVYILASKDGKGMRCVLEEMGINPSQTIGMGVEGLYAAMSLIVYPIPG